MFEPLSYEITPPADFSPIEVAPAPLDGFVPIEAHNLPAVEPDPEPVAPEPAPVEVADTHPDTDAAPRRAGKD